MRVFEMVSLRAFTWIQRSMFWVTCIGLFVTSYLLITYMSGQPITCGLVHGCDVVRASRWAHFLGFPLPLFGELYYFTSIALLMIRTSMPNFRRAHMRMLFLVIAAAAFIESAFLTLMEVVDIKAYCIWCLISAASATGVFVLSFFDTDGIPDTKQVNRNMLVLFVSLIVFVIAGVIGLRLLLR